MFYNKCKHCGEMPKVQTHDRCEGHGEYPTYIWLQCRCGMRTKEEFIGYDDLERKTVKDNLIKIWNGE